MVGSWISFGEGPTASSKQQDLSDLSVLEDVSLGSICTYSFTLAACPLIYGMESSPSTAEQPELLGPL